MTEDEVIAALAIEPPGALAELDKFPAALRTYAMYYATVGWPVFPLVPGEKRPLLPRAHEAGNPCKGECGGKTGHGLYDGTTNVAQVETWWRVTPLANIGVRTGERFDVIDIDVKDGAGGFESYAELKAEAAEGGHALPDVLAIAATGSGGRHVLVPPTGRGNAAGLRPGIDYRGVGGYIVIPPSRLAGTGGRYSWIKPPADQLVTPTTPTL